MLPDEPSNTAAASADLRHLLRLLHYTTGMSASAHSAEGSISATVGPPDLNVSSARYAPVSWPHQRTVPLVELERDDLERFRLRYTGFSSYTILLGPFVIEEPAAHSVHASLERIDSGSHTRASIMKFLTSLPVVTVQSVGYLAESLVLLCAGADSADTSVPTVEQESRQERPRRHPEPIAEKIPRQRTLERLRAAYLDHGVRHHPIALEREFLRRVRRGDRSVLDMLPDFEDYPVTPITDGTLERALRNRVIIAVALCARAAIDAGLDSEMMLTLGDVYIQQVEQAASQLDIARIEFRMFDDFVSRISNFRRSGISRPVARCISHIQQNLGERISVGSLSELSGVSQRHLSYLFSSQTGKTITQFVREQRVSAACDMLRYTTESLLDVALSLGFSSQSHFTQIFSAETGVTPGVYREQPDPDVILHRFLEDFADI